MLGLIFSFTLDSGLNEITRESRSIFPSLDRCFSEIRGFTHQNEENLTVRQGCFKGKEGPREHEDFAVHHSVQNLVGSKISIRAMLKVHGVEVVLAPFPCLGV